MHAFWICLALAKPFEAFSAAIEWIAQNNWRRAANLLHSSSIVQGQLSVT